jgi:signal transduction histidine kinase
VEVIERQVERLARLIQNLLDVSRVSAGRLELTLEDVDLRDVVREVVERAHDEIAAAGSTVLVEAPRPSIGRWDRLRLDQIVTNLLSNAIKYGGGKPIEVRVDDLPSSARLTVRDHGIGIAEEQQVRIFQRFERAVSSENYSGFGLGLWIVKRISDALGGTVGVASRPGEGAAFTVELPKRAAD